MARESGHARESTPRDLARLLGGELRVVHRWRPHPSVLVIYLHQVRHIPLGIAGLLIGGVAVLALPVAPSAGALVDRFGARVVLVALLVEGPGTVSLVTAHNTLTALPAKFVYGLGQAAGWPTWTPSWG